jgi:cysteine desulfurase family protein
MSDRIYMDNSATSFPKPAAVTDAMVAFAGECGASAGRGAYAEAKHCERIIAACRRRMADLINAESPDRIVFTMNCSEALAIAIRGLLNHAPAGAHAVATAMEHNSVLRPLNALAEQTGLKADFVPADPQTGLVDPDDVARALTGRTRLIACVHVSNVTGTIQPVEEIARMARERDIPFLLDAAQSGGHLAIDVRALGADLVAFAGHKGLLGPLGTGVLYVRPGFERRLPTMKEGGTGTISEQPRQPDTMPDKYEIGSHNAIGLAGLAEGLAWLGERGLDAIRAHDEELCRLFMARTDGVEGLTLFGPRDVATRTGVFSVAVDGMSPAELAAALEADFGLCARPGVHCAPLAHKTIGTHPAGTCRLSFGHFTSTDQVARAADALAAVAEKSGVRR